MALLLFALKWLQWKYLIADFSLDIYMGLIALFFTILGIWVANQLTKNRSQQTLAKDQKTQKVDLLTRFELTEREFEVLQQLIKGHSNAQIAENLYLSVSTIKTHVSNIYIKLDVKNRASAIHKVNELNPILGV